MTRPLAAGQATSATDPPSRPSPLPLSSWPRLPALSATCPGQKESTTKAAGSCAHGCRPPSLQGLGLICCWDPGLGAEGDSREELGADPSAMGPSVHAGLWGRDEH